MSRWGRLLLVSLPLAIALTAAFRFIQHTDQEYAFWVETFGATATQLEARCAASKSPDVCARAKSRRVFSEEFRTHRDAVMAWWWPVLLAMALAWIAAAASTCGLLCKPRRRETLPVPPPGKHGN